MRIFTMIILSLLILAVTGCSKKMITIKTQPQAEKKAYEIHPDKNANIHASEVQLRQAKQFFAREKFKQAQKHCEKAIEFNHRNWEAHYYLGLTMQKRKNYEVAIEVLGVGLKYSPDNSLVKSEIHYAIGSSWAQLGEFVNANKEFELALTFNPDNQFARDAKNRIKVKKTMKNWGKNADKKHDG